jgi:hypothetical protein
MKIEKKLIACSILALIIGVSSVFPLAFLMSKTAKAETSPEPWFSIDMPYAYWVTGDGPLDYDMPFPTDTDWNQTDPQTYGPVNFTVTTSDTPTNMTINDSPSVGVPIGFGLNETNSVHEQHMLMLNLTLNVDTTNEAIDGRVEYYQIDISSDKELIEIMNFFIGTNSNSSFTFHDLLDNIHFFRQDWFDTDQFNPKFGGGGGLLAYNWTAGFSRLWPEGGSGEGTLGGSGTARRVSALREAETLSVTIYRLGWVTFTGNSTIFTSANNEVVDQIQLEKFGEEGWLYNNLIPEDELADTDLLHPLSFEEMY